MGIYTGTIASFLTGEKPDSLKFKELTDMATARAGAWTTFTPTLLSSSGSPTVGNGTITGRYQRIGKTIDFSICLTLGSTTSLGTGFVTFGALPVAVAITSLHSLAVTLYDTSAAAGFAGGGFFDSGTVVRPVSSSGNITSAAPFTWATGDQIFVSGKYATS